MSFKFYDTCALINFRKEIFSSDEHFYISSITTMELENIKNSAKKDEETKYNARRVLDDLDMYEDLYTSVLYKVSYFEPLREADIEEYPDSKIVATAYNLKNQGIDIEFVTSDKTCKQMAAELGLNATRLTRDKENEYKGFLELPLEDNELATFYNDYLINNINHYNLLNNQYFIIKNNDKIVDKYKWTPEGYIQVPFQKVESKMFGKVIPKNGDHYQQIALDCLVNNQISMLRGPAGSGKSYLAFGYMFSLLERGKIDRIIIFCNTVATKGSAKLGYYPGSKDEKLLDSQIGNFLNSKLGDRFMVEKMIAEGSIVLLPMSDIRGYDTSDMRAAVYITEAQNLDIELMRLALQRIGEDSICILDGDSDAQVDLSMYAGNNNGMRRVSQIFRGNDIYGEVTLQKIHRSRIAELAQKL